jgi:hypothetical protein
VTSKKFIKFLRKSLKEFGLNLKRKVCFKKSLKKKRKKKRKLTSLPFGPAGLPAHQNPLAAARHPPLLFIFPADADIWALPVSLSPPLPFFFLTPLPSRPGAAA